MHCNEALTKMFATSNNTLSPDEVDIQCHVTHALNVTTNIVAVFHQKIDTQLQFSTSVVWQCTEEQRNPTPYRRHVVLFTITSTHTFQ